jgi:DNA-directed RNA polymerase specialized sigma24 family protein
MTSESRIQAVMKGRWSLTADTFERLLQALDPDRERAAVAYERLRYRIIGLLRWWGSPAAEQLADDTLDRVARKLQEGAQIPSESFGAYVRGVARLVFYESTREPLSPLTGQEPEILAPGASRESTTAADCLDRCLDSWEATDRDLLLRYYDAGRAAEIRRKMADELGISATALRIRTHRLRTRLEQCVAECLK